MDNSLSKRQPKLLAAIIICTFMALSGCQSSNQQPTAKLTAHEFTGISDRAADAEKPLLPETHPFGDIPDTQTFVIYRSPGGKYSLQVPEGWARIRTGDITAFIDKFDGVSIKFVAVASQLSVKTVDSGPVAELKRNGRAVVIDNVAAKELPAGPAVEVDFCSNSEPDSVTGRQVRLENKRFYFFHAGRGVELTLWAPHGADNIDQWKKIAESFRWN